MRFPPIEVWLNWPRANYDNPQTSGNALIISNVIFMILTILAVGLRLYTRIVVKRHLGYDDGAIVIALFFALSMGVTVILANAAYGWDRHLWDMPFNLFTPASICAFVAKIQFTMAATMTRISLILFFYRLVQDSNTRKYRWVLHASIMWNILVCLAFVLMTVFLCHPVRSYWTLPLMKGSTCLNEGVVTLVAGIINCISDLQCTLLPIPLIMPLQLPLRQRLGVMLLLCLGFIVTTAGIVRSYFIWKSLISSWDETWYAYYLWISASVEIYIAVLCACAPALKPLFTRVLQSLNTSLSSFLSSKASAHDAPNTTSERALMYTYPPASHPTAPSHARRPPKHRNKSSMPWLWSTIDTEMGGDKIELVAGSSVTESSRSDSVGKDGGVLVDVMEKSSATLLKQAEEEV